MIESMGALQLGLPSPTMIPSNCPLTVMDLKDWVFTIPLAEQDCPCFAFSIPAINNSEPMQCYHWTILPQGMKNRPTVKGMLQEQLSGVCEHYPQMMIYHDMDDILIAGAELAIVEVVVKETVKALHS